MLKKLREDLQRAEADLGEHGRLLEELLARFPVATRRKTLPKEVVEMLRKHREMQERLDELRTRYAHHCAENSW
jgi:hypothetical protein